MANKPIDISFEIEPYMTFVWMINKPTASNWTYESPILTLAKDFTSRCTLIMNWAYTNHNYYTVYSVNVKLQFVENELNFQDTTFKVILYLNSNPNNGYVFHLQQNSGNKKLFASQNLYVYNIAICAIENVKVLLSRNTNIATQEKLILSYIKMSQDMKQLLETGKNSDFKIRVQEQVFNVHKGILSSRCTVLAKMVESNMLENKRGELQFNNFDPIVVKELLSFIYTTEYNAAKMPHELFKLAHYLELKELQEGCKQFLLKNINHKNIVSTIELADEEQYDLEDLKKVATNFITKEEKKMSQDPEFLAYFCRAVSINNVFFVLKFANTYHLEELLQCAMDFVKYNYKVVLENSECKDFFLKHADLFIKINKYCFDSLTSQLNELRKD